MHRELLEGRVRIVSHLCRPADDSRDSHFQKLSFLLS